MRWLRSYSDSNTAVRGLHELIHDKLVYLSLREGDDDVRFSTASDYQGREGQNFRPRAADRVELWGSFVSILEITTHASVSLLRRGLVLINGRGSVLIVVWRSGGNMQSTSTEKDAHMETASFNSGSILRPERHTVIIINLRF